MTGGGCAVLAGRRGVDRGQGHVRQTRDAGGVRCGRLQARLGSDFSNGGYRLKAVASACLEDALACLAEQGAARRQARQYRGWFSGRRRWRLVARPAGKYPRIGKFHNTILHPHFAKPRAATLRHAHLCSPILHRVACADLASPLLPGIIVWCAGIYRKGCGKMRAPVAPAFGCCHLTVMRKAVSNCRV